MKKIINNKYFVMVLYILFLSQISFSKEILIIGDDVSLLSSSNKKNFQIIRKLPLFTTINLISEEGNYLHVRIDDKINGFIEKKYSSVIPQGWKLYKFDNMKINLPMNQKFKYLKSKSIDRDNNNELFYEHKFYNDINFVTVIHRKRSVNDIYQEIERDCFIKYKKYFKFNSKKYYYLKIIGREENFTAYVLCIEKKKDETSYITVFLNKSIKTIDYDMTLKKILFSLDCK